MKLCDSHTQGWMLEPYDFCGEPWYTPQIKTIENADNKEDVTDGSDRNINSTAKDYVCIFSLWYND